ncbi:hypothetical protein MPTK1_6g07850 [Marchantia polymorpha subsp. ruderalis]|uniref:Secreted protein n=2 Tax=Marchantia polymorpha TaxID=3197 RepID=A0AAF6BPN9_MARPO|nr:hypothetical protein MARPO_0053s0098 [Marchantia polymorpha]BBN13973.1 hypothetical protein Mp_6g07850 [Marchantia polymorpha subsp. ruderalis]|eukprot:PTQ38174.1 hypothetical protein MARPO_0053s0098 [Marchantia polymorpha]
MQKVKSFSLSSRFLACIIPLATSGSSTKRQIRKQSMGSTNEMNITKNSTKDVRIRVDDFSRVQRADKELWLWRQQLQCTHLRRMFCTFTRESLRRERRRKKSTKRWAAAPISGTAKLIMAQPWPKKRKVRRAVVMRPVAVTSIEGWNCCLESRLAESCAMHQSPTVLSFYESTRRRRGDRRRLKAEGA